MTGNTANLNATRQCHRDAKQFSPEQEKTRPKSGYIRLKILYIMTLVLSILLSISFLAFHYRWTEEQDTTTYFACLSISLFFEKLFSSLSIAASSRIYFRLNLVSAQKASFPSRERNVDRDIPPSSCSSPAAYFEFMKNYNQERRVARSCTLELKSSGSDCEDEAGCGGFNDFGSGNWREQEGYESKMKGEMEPYVGMIFEAMPERLIFEEKVEELAEEKGDKKKESISSIDERIGPGCILNRERKDGIVHYELLEQVENELGLVDVHSLDFAYRPHNYEVKKGYEKKISNQYFHQWMRQLLPILPWSWNEKIYENGYDVAVKSVGRPITHIWSRLSYFLGNGRKSNGFSTEEEKYEKMGERAFAGGSHGEVWRARRRCLSSTLDGVCDGEKELIMKRLKLEQGAALLEAGMREIYFGKLLASENLRFTTYVDHFFLEQSSDSFVRSETIGSKVELWIVFENGGPSLRSYLYTPVTSGDFVVYQPSSLWRSLRMSFMERTTTTKKKNEECSDLALAGDRGQNEKEFFMDNDSNSDSSTGYDSKFVGKIFMKEVLSQLLSSASLLHSRGIVHRDIKPSNYLCRVRSYNSTVITLDEEKCSVKCILADFSSAWDDFASENMYSNGASSSEQTDEYAPPEAALSKGTDEFPFDVEKPQSYDSWSIGVVALEMLLGTPNVFSVDQRTRVILTTKMKKEGASLEDIDKALYLAALSQFCIYLPMAQSQKSWPLRRGDPLHEASIVKPTCTLQDFHNALRARDPLGIGFDSSSDSLLQLIWELLAWDPVERITAEEALQHPFFTSSSSTKNKNPNRSNALEQKVLQPTMLTPTSATEFICPKCNRTFHDIRSCQMHTTKRRHAKFCDYNRTDLPPCLSSHSMLPAHPLSGYCDIQGRRQSIEDFHTIHLHPEHQFYGVFDGHWGNLASKYAASSLYDILQKPLEDIDAQARKQLNWTQLVHQRVNASFHNLHERFLEVVAQSPGGVMEKSGTTATVLYVTSEVLLVANVGDSRAILSRRQANGNMTSLQLTIDHTASQNDEKIRINKLGGYVESSGGIDRVQGTLAVTRSIGDAHLAHFLSRDPHVVAMTRDQVREQCELTPDFPCFVVLASDGLWDVLSNQEAIDLVVLVLREYDADSGISWEEGGAFQEGAQRLTQEAYVRGSTDNIGVCVVALV